MCAIYWYLEALWGKQFLPTCLCTPPITTKNTFKVRNSVSYQRDPKTNKWPVGCQEPLWTASLLHLCSVLGAKISWVLWFNSSWQLSPTEPLAHSTPGGMGERIRRVKVRKLMGWDKDSLIGKAKAVRTSKAKQGIHLLLPTGRQVLSHLQGSRAPSHVTVTWEDKHQYSECPPLPPPSPSFIHWVWYHMAQNIPLVGWITCPSCVPSQFPMCLAGWEAEKALTA